MSRYTHLTIPELEAEEAALTAALEAVRGKVRTAEQERVATLTALRATVGHIETKAEAQGLALHSGPTIHCLKLLIGHIERGEHTETAGGK